MLVSLFHIKFISTLTCTKFILPFLFLPRNNMVHLYRKYRGLIPSYPQLCFAVFFMNIIKYYCIHTMHHLEDTNFRSLSHAFLKQPSV
jgi:hypothetical protein